MFILTIEKIKLIFKFFIKTNFKLKILRELIQVFILKELYNARGIWVNKFNSISDSNVLKIYIYINTW